MKYIVEETLLQAVLNYIAKSRSDEQVKDIVSLVDAIRALKPEEEKKDE